MANNNNGRFSILQPIFQYGFAGMAAVLLGIIVWRIDCADKYMEGMIEVQRETNQVIERNTVAIGKLSQVVHDKL